MERLTKDKIGGEDAGPAEGSRRGACRRRCRRRRRALWRADRAGWPATSPALAGLARCYVQTDALDQARQTLALVPEAKRNEAAVAAARAALEVAEQAKTVGPIGELEQKVAANPLDHQARFDLAVALNAAGQARRKRPITCWRSSSATANGMTTAPASSWCSFSRRGARPTKRRSSGRKKLSSILFVLIRVIAARARGATSVRHEARTTRNQSNADERGLSRTERNAGNDPGVSAAGRAAAAARANAAQYFRAALSRDGRRCLARRPPADRHDPARSRAYRAAEDKPQLYKIGCVGRITQLAESGDGRYLLELTGVARFRIEEELTVHTDYRQAASLTHRSPTISSRARARTKSTAKRCCGR